VAINSGNCRARETSRNPNGDNWFCKCFLPRGSTKRSLVAKPGRILPIPVMKVNIEGRKPALRQLPDVGPPGPTMSRVGPIADPSFYEKRRGVTPFARAFLGP
jgi:hypothetical protein